MKGQTQAVTAVMVTGIVVGAVTSAYVWGAPIVEKRQGQANIMQTESTVLDLENKIRSVSQSGSGASEQVILDLDDGNVNLNADENYIDVITFSDNSPYPVGSWNMLRGQSRQGASFGAGSYGIQGENVPGIVAVKKDSGGGSRIRYRVEFRNLRATTASGPELRLVDLKSSGAQTASGDVTIQLTNQGTEEDTGSDSFEIQGGEDIRRTRRLVEVDFR